MIQKAKEGEITWFPGLTPSAIPHPVSKGINIHLKRAVLGLEPQGVVGAIPLRNGDTLQIVPKIGHVNFLRLLFKAEGHQPGLEREYNEFVDYSVDNKENIDSIIARQLLYCAAEILRRSPRRERVSRQHVGIFAAGQINTVATVLNVTTRKEEPVVYVSKDRTEDIAENRVITEAILRAWASLDELTCSMLRPVRDRWVTKFRRSPQLHSDLVAVQRAFAAGKYGGPRDYYRKALMLSQIVLGTNGLGFDEAATVEGDAILLNTAHIFEKYLRNVINDAYNETGYVVTKGGVGTTTLYTDGSFELIPDIVVTKDNRTLLIADAKYKAPTINDHYQMAVYLAANQVKRGLLLAPLFEGDEVIVQEYSTWDKVVIREVYLPLTNLQATEDYLSTVVKRFAS